MKTKRDKNALTVGIAVSVVMLVSLAVVSQSVKTTNNIESYPTNDDGGSRVSINDVLDIKPQTTLGESNRSDSQNSNNVANTNESVQSNEEDEITANSDISAEPDTSQSKNSVTVSVDGYDLANATWPVSSKEIIMEYSYNTTPVYSETYKEYRSDHTGIDIKAKQGEEVKCAYAGKISEITFDDRLGNLIKVEHAEGIYSIYANLDKDIKVTLHQKVDEGEVLGVVGNSAASESAEESHLHFAVIAFGDYINPLEYIKTK